MELTPQTLHAVEFREARRNGYNTRDVDDFLEQVAEGVGQLHGRLRDAMARAESAEGRLGVMQRQLEELQRRPPAAAAPEMNETDDTLRRTLVLAQRTADATIKEAKDDAARLVGEAREEAARIRAEIEAEARKGTEGARQAAEAELEHLLETRDTVSGELEALRALVDEQRDQIRSGIAEFERMLDDPAALTAVASPELTEVDRHAFSTAPAGPEPAEPTPSRPSLPSRGSSPVLGGLAPEPAAANGRGPDFGAPFKLGAHVASLQEAPPLPSRREPTPEPSAPVHQPAAQAPQPVQFATFSGPEPSPEVHQSPWPSQLRTSVTDDGAPPAGDAGGGAPPAPLGSPANGAVEGFGLDPGSRPSEWGRRVFDQIDQVDEPDDDAPFGRH